MYFSLSSVSQNDYFPVGSPSWMSVGKTKECPETDGRHTQNKAS